MIFDHLGLVVSSLDKGRRHLSAGLRIGRWTQEFRDEVNGVLLQFGIDDAGVCFELIQPLDETSPVHHALKTKNVMHHVAYRVPDLTQWQDHFARNGWARTTDPKPAIAYGGRRIQFFVSPIRLIAEMIEAPDHQHLYALAQPAS